jgi:hypothetical protein
MRIPPTALPASMAPRLAASIIPGPPPVHVGDPSSVETSRPSSRDITKCGESALRRADP